MTFHFHFINHKCVDAHITGAGAATGTTLATTKCSLSVRWQSRGAPKRACIELLLTFRLLLRALSFDRQMHFHCAHSTQHTPTHTPNIRRTNEFALAKNQLSPVRAVVRLVKVCVARLRLAHSPGCCTYYGSMRTSQSNPIDIWACLTSAAPSRARVSPIFGCHAIVR